MPSKARRSSSKTSSSQKLVKRKSAASPLLSSDEKHQLILAHAAARKPHDPFQRLMVYGVAAVCFLFIAGVWLSTIGTGIEKIKAETPDSTFSQDMTQSVKQIKDERVTQGLEVWGRAKEQGAEFREEQHALEVLVQELSKTSVASSTAVTASSTSSTMP